MRHTIELIINLIKYLIIGLVAIIVFGIVTGVAVTLIIKISEFIEKTKIYKIFADNQENIEFFGFIIMAIGMVLGVFIAAGWLISSVLGW